VQLIGHRDGLRRANATIRRGSHLTLTSAMHAPSAANDNAKALIHFAAQLAIWSTTGVLCWTDFRTVGRQSRSADATGVYGARLRLPLALARTGLSQRSTKGGHRYPWDPCVKVWRAASAITKHLCRALTFAILADWRHPSAPSGYTSGLRRDFHAAQGLVVARQNPMPDKTIDPGGVLVVGSSRPRQPARRRRRRIGFVRDLTISYRPIHACPEWVTAKTSRTAITFLSGEDWSSSDGEAN